MEIKTASDLLTASARGCGGEKKKKKPSLDRVVPVTMIRTTLTALIICQYWPAKAVQF